MLVTQKFLSMSGVAELHESTFPIINLMKSKSRSCISNENYSSER